MSLCKEAAEKLLRLQHQDVYFDIKIEPKKLHIIFDVGNTDIE